MSTAAVRRWTLVRLIVFGVVLLAGDTAAQLTRIELMRHVPERGRDWIVLGGTAVLAAVLIALYAGLVRGLERRRALEARFNARRLVLGAALGTALFTAVFAVLCVLGVAHWRGLSPHADVFPQLAAALIAAVGEELTFRGGVFRVLADGFGTTAALIVSAGIFGLLHALNPGATLLSSVAIMLEAGVLLGAAYAYSDNLWLPIGIHLGWNFTEGGLFGVSVSGYHGTGGLVAVSLAGPPLLTGGPFGPEASLVAVALCLVAGLAFIVLALRRKRWIAARARLVLE